MALDGQARLYKKKDELTEELRKLEQMEAERRDENGKIKMKQSAAEREAQENQEYYDAMRKKLSDYMGHLQKRNEAQRQQLLKTQIMNAYLENSDYPFEAIFQDAISQVKEEISDRKN